MSTVAKKNVSASSSETRRNGVAVFDLSLFKHKIDKVLPQNPNTLSNPIHTASMTKSYTLHVNKSCFSDSVKGCIPLKDVFSVTFRTTAWENPESITGTELFTSAIVLR
jgi:hypothetical protein